jgi:hypothetical protein
MTAGEPQTSKEVDPLRAKNGEKDDQRQQGAPERRHTYFHNCQCGRLRDRPGHRFVDADAVTACIFLDTRCRSEQYRILATAGVGDCSDDDATLYSSAQHAVS